jgi:uncharacterized protein YbjT (DUF2867 family)
MKALLAGGTGLVGSNVLDLLIAAGTEVTSLGRRPSGRVASCLTEIDVKFDQLPELPPADVAICALGTTMKLAGSQEAFARVDYYAVRAFARAALTAGAKHFILVSAVGADPESKIFYSKIKGIAETDASTLPFARLDIMHPGLIIGPRTERRPFEAAMQRIAPIISPLMIGPLDKYCGIRAETVARAIVALTVQTAPGRYIRSNRAMRRLAR